MEHLTVYKLNVLHIRGVVTVFVYKVCIYFRRAIVLSVQVSCDLISVFWNVALGITSSCRYQVLMTDV